MGKIVVYALCLFGLYVWWIGGIEGFEFGLETLAQFLDGDRGLHSGDLIHSALC